MKSPEAFPRSLPRHSPSKPEDSCSTKSLGYQIELHYLWRPSPELAIRRIAQRVKMGGHHIPEADVRRRFTRSWTLLIHLCGPLADTWQVWDNRNKPTGLIMSPETSTLSQLE